MSRRTLSCIKALFCRDGTDDAKGRKGDLSRTPIYLTKKHCHVTRSVTNCITTLERGNDRRPEERYRAHALRGYAVLDALRPVFGAYLPGVSVRRCLP
jgi:hypothetical protein